MLQMSHSPLPRADPSRCRARTPARLTHVAKRAACRARSRLALQSQARTSQVPLARVPAYRARLGISPRRPHISPPRVLSPLAARALVPPVTHTRARLALQPQAQTSQVPLARVPARSTRKFASRHSAHVSRGCAFYRRVPRARLSRWSSASGLVWRSSHKRKLLKCPSHRPCGEQAQVRISPQRPRFSRLRVLSGLAARGLVSRPSPRSTTFSRAPRTAPARSTRKFASRHSAHVCRGCAFYRARKWPRFSTSNRSRRRGARDCFRHKCLTRGGKKAFLENATPRTSPREILQRGAFHFWNLLASRTPSKSRPALTSSKTSPAGPRPAKSCSGALTRLRSPRFAEAPQNRDPPKPFENALCATSTLQTLA